MNDDPRAKTVARIRALLAKTTENGATQEEALAATAKATALMDRYEISFAEVRDQKDEGFAERKLSPEQRWKAEFLSWIGVKIGHFTGVTLARSISGKTTYGVTYFGQESDVIFAEWLLSAVSDFVFAGYKAALKAFKVEYPYADRASVNRFRRGYMYGAAQEINRRIEVMLRERVQAQTANGNALTVISKSEIARNEYLRRNPHLLPNSGYHIGNLSRHGTEAGAERGRQAQFHKPVGHGGPLMLGNK